MPLSRSSPRIDRSATAEENEAARHSDNRALLSRRLLERISHACDKKTRGDIAEAGRPSRVGKRGSVVIPAALRRRYGIEEGSFVVAEPCEGGVLIRPALVLPVEVYTPERKAQFLLSNAVDAADYAGAVAEVRAMGLDPKTIPHYKPRGV